MKTFAPALLLFAVFAVCLPAQAAPTAARADDVREAVFRTLFVHAHALMPEAKVYKLEKDGHHPPEWGNVSDFNPSIGLLQRFADNVPPVIPVSQSGGGASPEGVWRENKNHAHGALVQIVSLHWMSDTSVEAETDVEGETYTDKGLPWVALSLPYRVTWDNEKWIVQEDVRKEWQQAVQEGDIREAVVREQLAVGVYGRKPETTPCFLSFGLFGAGVRADPPEAFMARFAGGPIRLRKASQRPGFSSRKPYMLIGVEHVRWVSGTEAEVDGSGTCNNTLSTVSILYDVTRGKNGWDVKPIFGLSI